MSNTSSSLVNSSKDRIMLRGDIGKPWDVHLSVDQVREVLRALPEHIKAVEEYEIETLLNRIRAISTELSKHGKHLEWTVRDTEETTES